MTSVPSLKNLEKLPLPSFYNPKNAFDWDYRPDIKAIKAEAVEYRKKYGIKPAAFDKFRVYTMLVDMQKDFLHKNGALYVAGRSGTGAPDDACRTVEFIYHYLYLLTKLVPTLDTHQLIQIFHPMFVETADGGPVAPFTNVEVEDWESGKIRPTLAAANAVAGGNLMWLTKQCIHYSKELRSKGKMALTIWPEHCLLGTEGHALLGIVQEALLFHSYARGVDPSLQVKGGNRLTENYSIYGPEVTTRWDGGPIAGAQKNTHLLEDMSSAHRVIKKGQAGSHCVAETGRDYKNEIGKKDPALLQKVYVVEDCMSPVTVPDGKGGFFVDCTPMQEAALREYRDAGMHVVKSTDALASWPGFSV